MTVSSVNFGVYSLKSRNYYITGSEDSKFGQGSTRCIMHTVSDCGVWIVDTNINPFWLVDDGLWMNQSDRRPPTSKYSTMLIGLMMDCGWISRIGGLPYPNIQPCWLCWWWTVDESIGQEASHIQTFIHVDWVDLMMDFGWISRTGGLPHPYSRPHWCPQSLADKRLWTHQNHCRCPPHRHWNCRQFPWPHLPASLPQAERTIETINICDLSTKQWCGSKFALGKTWNTGQHWGKKAWSGSR